MKKLIAEFLNEPSVAIHAIKGLATATIAAVVLWPLSSADVVVVAAALGLSVPAGLGARALTRPAKPR